MQNNSGCQQQRSKKTGRLRKKAWEKLWSTRQKIVFERFSRNPEIFWTAKFTSFS